MKKAAAKKTRLGSDIIPSVYHFLLDSHQLRSLFKVESFWQGSAAIFLLMVIGKSLSFLWKILLARLGTEALGTAQLTFTLLTFLAYFSLLGLQTSLVRYVAILRQKNKHKDARSITQFTLVVSTAIALLLTGLFFFFPNLATVAFGINKLPAFYIRIIILGLPFIVLSEIITSYFTAAQQYLAFGIGKYVLPPMFRLLLLSVFLSIGLSNNLSLSLLFLISSVSTLLLLIVLKKDRISFSSLRLKSSPIIQEFLHYSLPISSSFLLYILYGSLDTFFLSKYTTLATVGLFGAILVLLDVTDMFFLPSLNLLSVHLSKLHQNRWDGFTFLIKKMYIFLIISVLIFVGYFFLKTQLISVVFGKNYLIIAPFLLPFLIIRLVETIAILPLRHFLDFYGKVKLTLAAMASSTVIRLLCCFLFIPHFGIWGILFSQLISNLFHLFLCLCFTWWSLHFRPNLKSE